MVMMMVVMVMMPPLILRTVAGRLAIGIEASFLTATRVLERRLDVLVDGPLAIRSWRGKAHLADRTSGRRCDRRYRRVRGRR